MKPALRAVLGSTLALLVACGASPGTAPLPVLTPGPAAPAPAPQPVCAPVSLGLGGTLSAAAAQAAPDWSAPHVPGEVLVLPPAAGALSAQALTALAGVQVQKVDAELWVARTPARETDAAFARRLASAGVQVQPNFLYPPLALPNDPGFPGRSGIRVEGRVQHQDYLPRIRAAQAWDALDQAGVPKNGVLTAVLDTGVDATHPDLQGRLLPGCTFGVDGQVSVGAPEVDARSSQGRGHGTSSAGLIGATVNNGVGLSGLTWQGRNLLPLKVISEAGASTTSLRQGVAYAVSQGAKVINMSLGMPGDPGDRVLAATLSSAARSAVLVAAAGNRSDQGIFFPASHPDVIAVGALARQDRLACYSARPGVPSGDRQLDIVAPGGNAGTSDEVTTSSLPCLQDSPDDLLTLTSTDQGSYALRAGTSEAAPLVSGVASLMWAANPALSAPEVKARLLASSRRAGGLPLLDAEAAVKAALR